MKLMGWLIGGFAIYLAATGQLMNYIELALTPSNPQTPTSGGKPSGLSGSVLNQVMPSIIGGSTGGSAGTAVSSGTAGAIGTGATSAGSSAIGGITGVIA